MKNYDKIVGENMRDMRIKVGLTQQELANFLHKSLHTVQKYESGDIPISISLLKYLSIVFGADIEKFFECDQ